MLKSSKSMLRYKEIELEKLKKHLSTSDGDVKLPKIYQSPGKNTQRELKNDFR